RRCGLESDLEHAHGVRRRPRPQRPRSRVRALRAAGSGRQAVGQRHPRVRRRHGRRAHLHAAGADSEQQGPAARRLRHSQDRSLLGELPLGVPFRRQHGPRPRRWSMPLILRATSIALLLVAPAAPPARDGRVARQAEGTPKQEAKKQDDKKKKKDGKKKEDGKKGKKKDDEYPKFKLDDHPSIHFAKGTHLDFRGRFAADVKDSDAPNADPTETSAIDLGKKRVGVSGEIANVVEFQVEAELRQDRPWRDVYAEYKQFSTVRVRGGQFKIPFSLDENTSASHLDFMFRSLAATHLAPGRDQGVMLHGRVVDKTIAYEAGVFRHDGKNARRTNPDKVYGGQTTAARVTYEPFRNVKDANTDLSVGGAYTTSDVPEGIPGLRGLMVFDQKFFSSSQYIVNGKRRRTGVEMQLRPGPASVKAEWMRVETERLGESVEGTDPSPPIGQGWD